MLLAACGGSSSPAPSEPPGASGAAGTAQPATTESSSAAAPPAAPPAPKPDLGSLLLTINDVPTGWSTYTSEAGAAEGRNGCYTMYNTLEADGGEFVKQSFSFGGYQLLQETLYRFGDAPTAAAEYDKVIAALQACNQTSYTASGFTFMVSVGQMSFPPLSAKSTAWNVTLQPETTGPATVNLVFSTHDDIVMILSLANTSGVPDVSDLQKFSAQAYAKLG